MKSVDMGVYYNTATLGLVRTVARGFDNQSGEPMIMYAPVDNNGCMKDFWLMPEKEFINTVNKL